MKIKLIKQLNFSLRIKILFSILTLVFLVGCTAIYSDDTNNNTDNDFPKNDEVNENNSPLFEFNGKKYYDYGSYYDEATLDKIFFGKVVSASMVTSKGVGIYGGCVWDYVNALNDVIRVRYDSNNSKRIKSIYVVYNEYVFQNTPLYYEKAYMTIDYWKKCHPLYNLEYYEDKAIQYTSRYDCSINEDFLQQVGFKKEYVPHLMKLTSVVPFHRLASVIEDGNGYKLYFKSNYDEELVSYYGTLSLVNGKISFIDKNDVVIIDNGKVSSSYYYSFFIETKYLYDYISYKINAKYDKFDEFLSVKNTRLSNIYPSKNTFKFSGIFYTHKNEKSIRYNFELLYNYDKDLDTILIKNFSYEKL